MEKTLTVEERIRRAEEIYQKRNNIDNISINHIENKKEKKDIKLFKKMIIQIIVCVLIYGVILLIQNSNQIFSKEFINKVNNILSYDTNFLEIYNSLKEKFYEFQNNVIIDKKENNENNENNDKNNTEKLEENKENEEKNKLEAIGGAESKEEVKEKSQEEKDIDEVKKTSSFIKPVNGKITSKYGYRENATGKVPKNHTGTDIANEIGTKIISATDGEVVLESSEGDYGKHLKIQIGEVSIIYAHCNKLYVKHGDKVKQGQEIGEIGTTGNSTGPHLHFEIRYQERTVDPEKILEL